MFAAFALKSDEPSLGGDLSWARLWEGPVLQEWSVDHHAGIFFGLNSLSGYSSIQDGQVGGVTIFKDIMLEDALPYLYAAQAFLKDWTILSPVTKKQIPLNVFDRSKSALAYYFFQGPGLNNKLNSVRRLPEETRRSINKDQSEMYRALASLNIGRDRIFPLSEAYGHAPNAVVNFIEIFYLHIAPVESHNEAMEWLSALNGISLISSAFLFEEQTIW